MTALLLLTLTAAPASVYSLEDKAFQEQALKDLYYLHHFEDGLALLMKQVDKNKDLFTKVEKQAYSPDQKRLLLSTWAAFFALFSSTEQIRQRYWNFVKLLPNDSKHALGFLLTHTALTGELGYGLTFAGLTAGNPQLETIFDEQNGELGLPKGSFADFKVKAIHVSTSTQLMTGDAWEGQALGSLKKQKLADDTEVKWAVDAMKEQSKVAKSRLKSSGVTLFNGNAADILKDTTTSAIFPAQIQFATWAGDTRVQRIGKPLVTAEQIAKLAPKLEPGDVVVVRQNWFLSNIALPGFWPHAELYVGTPDDLVKYFDSDPEVQKWAASEPEKAKSFTELLSKRYADKWKFYQAGKDFMGHSPIRVIEAISEGVSFTALEHAFGVDYLGAMRPRLPKLEKAKAIARAFNYQGRPYDFEFDFFSDSSLVCTELVYKSYAPSGDMKGIKIPLVEVAGRSTLPANEIVRLFDAEADKADRQLDFVAFIDAKEKEDKAFESDQAAFRKTYQRMKWDIAQK